MPYEGEVLTKCSTEFDFTQTWAVVVSGSGPNKWGHMLLYTGGAHPTYFQIQGELRAMPVYMNQAGYERYLRENGKKELKRIRISLPNPDRATAKMEELLSQKWTWGVVWHNCESFVEEIIHAGGGPSLHGDHWMNLPTEAKLPKVSRGASLLRVGASARLRYYR